MRIFSASCDSSKSKTPCEPRIGIENEPFPARCGLDSAYLWRRVQILAHFEAKWCGAGFQSHILLNRLPLLFHLHEPVVLEAQTIALADLNRVGIEPAQRSDQLHLRQFNGQLLVLARGHIHDGGSSSGKPTKVTRCVG